MSMTTPPPAPGGAGGPAGWYRDPDAPHTERWWDGTAWTAHSRAAGAAGDPQGQTPGGQGGVFGPAQGGAFGPAQGGAFGPARPHAAAVRHSAPGTAPTGGGKDRGGKRLMAMAGAGVALVAAVAAAALLLGPDDGGSTTGASPTGSTTAAGEPTTDPKGSPPAMQDATVMEDQLNGIAINIPQGWVRAETSLEPGATIYTDETYECPGGGSALCRHGRVSSMTANDQANAGSPEALAKADITRAAEAVYGEDTFGDRPHGGIESHKVLKSQNVAVAGKAGYLVRWRVVTGEGPGGYVQTIALPSPAGTGALMVVRFAFDAGPSAPGLDVMDEIAASIRPIGDTTGGGVGSSIGPG